MLDEARTLKDPRGRAVLESDGEKARAAWRCPHAKTKAATLSKAHVDVLERVSLLIGAPLPQACPCSHARTPVAHRIVKLRQWRDKGQLELVCPRPSQVVVDALDAYTAGTTGLEAHLATEAQREIEKAKRKAGTK